ncbi:DUF1467 domain-containing protein [Halobiforma lacisalsi AJ5]|uniref:DUF1467 domain-containing protein n=1 Tax=Natronobacterium lacisalsi AJ5 TaxID=358396 RepID=M0LJK1_NATLA|nr:hypothetical protein [Halobiforma lacisalsi]APW98718.1 DUF1467 domain-containing protein [Halobiforma lacisalsi AJ5]EMA32589.1 hypothetical protein C445_10747 [Halobiforma lacisalsi AJ5]
MRVTELDRSRLLTAVSVPLVAAGVASTEGFTPSVRTLLALALVTVGVFGATRAVGDRPVDALWAAARRWWAVAFVSFLPYGLATAPANEGAAAVGEAFADPAVLLALEAIAGTAALCAIAITTLSVMASYGVHPGAPSPEERVLED